MHKEHFTITGMTCSACSSRVDKAVTALSGVTEVSVNLLTNSMSVIFDEGALATADITGAVERAGYGAAPRGAKPSVPGTGEGANASAQEHKAMRRRLAVSCAFSIPLFLFSMGHMVGLPLPHALSGPENALAFAFTQFLLMLPVVVVNGAYYRVGFKTLVSGAPNMDTLIAVGSGAAVVHGVCAIYAIGNFLGAGDSVAAHHVATHLYCESAAMILTLITLGKYFEARAKGRTTDAVAALLRLAPDTATVLRNGKEAVVPREEVQAGELLVVKAGESVPVDGEVTEGRAFVDESALTGESLPLEKTPGQSVTGATMVASGYFVMRAVRVGEDTTLARIVRLVDEAVSSKAPIARLADTVSGVFVPAVILVAVVAATVWFLLGYGLEFALSIGISVLVISCPCALGLATPTAIMVGTGRGASSGILFKSAEAVEVLQSVDVVVLDKTGTVTLGKPEITDILPVQGEDEATLLLLAASLEKRSEHPLGAAVVRGAQARGIVPAKVEKFIHIPGRGIAGTVNGEQCLAGNLAMLATEKVDTAEMVPHGIAFAREGKTPLYFARNGRGLGIIAVADVIKPTSRAAVAELRALGADVVMLTGDNALTAAAIARQAGIDSVMADALPHDKEREIRLLREQGKKVAMIGDGINDAPALARADVGIAIGAGTDIAIESADIVLMKSDLLDAASAMHLSRAVLRTIRQNLFWAFFYNVIGIPVAAGAFYGAWGLTLNPMIAAAAMSLSSVSVVSNALRLRSFRPVFRAVAREGALCVTATNPIRSETMNKTIGIEGMNCGHCAASVEKALRAVPGVAEAKVDLAAKNATVTLNAAVENALLAAAVTEAGFEVKSVG